jgi:hypothetical protein
MANESAAFPAASDSDDKDVVSKSQDAQMCRANGATAPTMGKSTGGNGKPAARKASTYESLIQAKRLADAMGGVEKARAALDVLAKLV